MVKITSQLNLEIIGFIRNILGLNIWQIGTNGVRHILTFSKCLVNVFYYNYKSYEKK